jgi:hypothetical protein
MNPSQERLTHALESYAAALSELTPSPELEARMQAAMQREVTLRPRQARRQRWAWTLAASILMFLGVSVAVMQTQRTAQQLAAERQRALAQIALTQSALTQSTLAQDAARLLPHEVSNAAMVFPTGAASLWPTQGTVFRVRSTLNGLDLEQQYWIDVRLANDGSMRIVRILSADGTELFARPRIEP